MSTEGKASIDMVRWTFSANPARREMIEDYLIDLGLDVSIREECQFVALWDEPDPDADFETVVEDLWTLNEGPFEITHEVFDRRDMLVFHPEASDTNGEERAVA